jgi:hypothetical protein
MGAVLYIYIPTSLDKKYVYKPTPSEVPDVSVTHEIWYMAPVSVKRVGVLIVGDEIKHKLFKHPTIKNLEETLIWYNYKRFKRKPTKEEIKKYLSTQSAYQEYLKNYRLGVLKGIVGTLAGLSVFALIGSQIKKVLL